MTKQVLCAATHILHSGRSFADDAINRIKEPAPWSAVNQSRPGLKITIPGKLPLVPRTGCRTAFETTSLPEKRDYRRPKKLAVDTLVAYSERAGPPE
ncbi:hypothetical protein [Paraburkholderia phenazinium]|uniref:hypothetical protein n=1 Tax=Paraburkholderia phenazinium TaxID=60549 RepID=UPI00158DF3C6|nr:hypothetical protein [Paraburkholderia phenazinium]